MTALDLYGLIYVVPVLVAAPVVSPWFAHVITDYIVERT